MFQPRAFEKRSHTQKGERKDQEIIHVGIFIEGNDSRKYEKRK